MIWLRWCGRQALAILGWQGLAGIGLMLASGMFCIGMFAPLHADVVQLRADAFSSYQRHRQFAPIAAEQEPAAQLEKFYGFFLSDDALTDLLARLFRIGDAHGLTLRHAEYRTNDERSPRLGQYRVILPVTATYPQLKQFLAAVLTEIPIISLDLISLQRRAVGDSTVDAQLQFTLYLRQKS